MDAPSRQSPGKSDGIKLFLLGFATLFLELVLIRYLAGNIWNLGYFPNLVLLAVFVGMGVGFIFHHYLSERLSPLVFQAAFFMLLVLVVFVFYKHPAVPGTRMWQSDVGGELFFTYLSDGKTEETGYFPFLFEYHKTADEFP